MKETEKSLKKMFVVFVGTLRFLSALACVESLCIHVHVTRHTCISTRIYLCLHLSVLTLLLRTVEVTMYVRKRKRRMLHDCRQVDAPQGIPQVFMEACFTPFRGYEHHRHTVPTRDSTCTCMYTYVSLHTCTLVPRPCRGGHPDLFLLRSHLLILSFRS